MVWEWISVAACVCRFSLCHRKKIAEQLGSSGHGNHFVDVGFVEIAEFSPRINLHPGQYFAVLSHSGSRNFGSEVCKHYTQIAKDKLELSGESARLAWLDLDSEEGQEYWAAMQLAGDYSHANHRIIHHRLSKRLVKSQLPSLKTTTILPGKKNWPMVKKSLFIGKAPHLPELEILESFPAQ